MTILNPAIYIDESGNLTAPNDPFVVVAALVAEQHDAKLIKDYQQGKTKTSYG